MTHNFGVSQIQATFSTMAFSGPCSPAVSWRTQIQRFFWVLVWGVELKGCFWSPFQQMFSLQWMWNSQFYLQMVIWCDLCWWHRLLTSSYEQGLLHPSSRTKMLQNRLPFAVTNTTTHTITSIKDHKITPTSQQGLYFHQVLYISCLFPGRRLDRRRPNSNALEWYLGFRS